MVSIQTCVLMLTLSSFCFAAEEFFDEKPVKKTSLSKARRESLDALEALGHDLATEIERASTMLQDVMWTVRDIAEGEGKSAGMTALQKDRAYTVTTYKKMLQETRSRVSELERKSRFFRKTTDVPVSHQTTKKDSIVNNKLSEVEQENKANVISTKADASTSVPAQSVASAS